MNKKDELIVKIREASKRRDEQAAIKHDNEQQELKDLIARIEKCASESFPTLFAVAEELAKNGYYIGDKISRDSLPTFCTDRICHRLGFYLASGNILLSAKSSMPIAFGNAGGGWCGIDFKISKEGKVISFDYSLEAFEADEIQYATFDLSGTNFIKIVRADKGGYYLVFQAFCVERAVNKWLLDNLQNYV